MTFPTIASVATSSQTTDTTTHTVAMPSGSGGKLVAAIITDGRPIDSGDFANNWTQRVKQADGGDHVTIFVYEKTADGTEGADETFTTDVGQTSAHRVWRITGVGGGTAVEVAGFEAPGANTSCDPPANNPVGWDAEDTLWIAVLGIDSGTTGVSAYPSSYTNTGIVNSGNDADGVSVAWATRENNTASEDPEAYTITVSEFYSTVTIAVRPAGLVELIAVGTKSAGNATATSIAYPAGVAAGRLVLAGRSGWRSDITMADESGWTNTAELGGGTGTATDAHTTKIRVDRKELAGSESGSVTFDQSGSTNPGCLGLMLNYDKQAGTTWDVAATTGDDATHGANRAVTGSGTVSLQPGDVVVAFVATDTDTNLASFASPAVTASGITFGTTTRRSPASGGVNTGDDGNIEAFDAVVTAGTATAAPALAFTTATNQCGPAAFIRLRAASGAITGTVAVTQDAQTSSTTGQLGYTGTSATTQAAQSPTASGTANDPITGTVATTQADQTATASGQLGSTGTVALTQADQSSTAAGQLGYTATAAETQAAQVPAGSGQLGYSGSAAITQAAQTSTSSGTLGYTGTTAVTQADQTATTSGQLGATGTFAVTQAAQTSDASGAVVAEGIAGNVAATQDAQTAAASGHLGYAGTVAVTQAPQVGAATGTSALPVTGTLDVVQANQTAAAAGTVLADGQIPFSAITFRETFGATYRDAIGVTHRDPVAVVYEESI